MCVCVCACCSQGPFLLYNKGITLLYFIAFYVFKWKREEYSSPADLNDFVRFLPICSHSLRSIRLKSAVTSLHRSVSKLNEASRLNVNKST